MHDSDPKLVAEEVAQKVTIERFSKEALLDPTFLHRETVLD